MREVVITGVGVTTAIGQGRAAFLDALLAGRSRFSAMSRPGRQLPGGPDDAGAGEFIGAEIASLTLPATLPGRMLRSVSLSGRVALATLDEAWHDARLDEVDPMRIGLIVGGSNLQQRELVEAQRAQRDTPWFVRPSYATGYLDSDLCGLCSEAYAIRGFAHTVGGASASGQLAVLHAIDAVRAARVDVCIAIGGLADLSYWELQALRNTGAMGSDRFAGKPQEACRPFDEDRDGFIFGESCAAVVVESADAIRRRGVRSWARCAASAVTMDRHRGPDPSLAGEMTVIAAALRGAGWRPSDVDYVNPHGSGSVLGDKVELEALYLSGLGDVPLNATKSATGHGLAAAGAVEIVATVLQMSAGCLHPSVNLDTPCAPDRAWVRGERQACRVYNALTLSFGFGGLNTALCLQAA